MHDLYALISILLVVSPIVIGILLFIGQWAAEEFYKEPLYDYDQEDSQG